MYHSFPKNIQEWICLLRQPLPHIRGLFRRRRMNCPEKTKTNLHCTTLRYTSVKLVYSFTAHWLNTSFTYICPDVPNVWSLSGRLCRTQCGRSTHFLGKFSGFFTTQTAPRKVDSDRNPNQVRISRSQQLSWVHSWQYAKSTPRKVVDLGHLILVNFLNISVQIFSKNKIEQYENWCGNSNYNRFFFYFFKCAQL